MSLKAFHVVFIVFSTTLLLGFGLWAIREYRQIGGGVNLAFAAGALLGAVALVWYGKWFWRKIKDAKYA